MFGLLYSLINCVGACIAEERNTVYSNQKRERARREGRYYYYDGKGHPRSVKTNSPVRVDAMGNGYIVKTPQGKTLFDSREEPARIENERRRQEAIENGLSAYKLYEYKPCNYKFWDYDDGIHGYTYIDVETGQEMVCRSFYIYELINAGILQDTQQYTKIQFKKKCSYFVAKDFHNFKIIRKTDLYLKYIEENNYPNIDLSEEDFFELRKLYGKYLNKNTVADDLPIIEKKYKWNGVD